MAARSSNSGRASTPGAIVDPGHVHPLAARDVVHPRHEVQRVAGLGEVAEHHGPDPGLAGQPPRQVEPDVVAGSSRWRARRSCSRSWSTTVRSFHCDRLSASMLTLPSRSQSTERSSRRLSNGSTSIECRGLTPAGGPLAAPTSPNARQHRQRRPRRPRCTAAAGATPARPPARSPASAWRNSSPVCQRSAGLLLQRAHDGRGKRARGLRPQSLDRRRPLGDVLGHDDPVGPGERRPPGEHLVGDDAERVEIAPAVDLLAGGLLRAHVAGRAHRDALAGAGAAGLAGHRAGDAEVGQQRPSGRRLDQHVLRLHVAVHHARPGRPRRAPRPGRR